MEAEALARKPVTLDPSRRVVQPGCDVAETAPSTVTNRQRFRGDDLWLHLFTVICESRINAEFARGGGAATGGWLSRGSTAL